MLNLSSSIKEIHKVGTATARQLKNLNIETVEDLLFYYPSRYDDFSVTTPIKALRAGTMANVVGYIELIQNKRSPVKKINITEALASDDTGSAKIVWFNQPFIGRNLRAGDKVSLSGKIEEDYAGVFLNSPNYEKIAQSKGAHTQGLVPNYRLSGNLTQKQLRFLITQIIGFAPRLKDWLPDEVKKNLSLVDLGEAISNIHFPKNNDKLSQAKRRLGFEELFLMQLQSRKIKNNFKQLKAEPIQFKQKETQEFVNSLPFKLTDSQKITAWEILQDIEKKEPMTRLLEGDVGSGKTVVALIAMINTALNKSQSVLMAPTEILASQHFDLVSKLLAETEIRSALLTRSERKITKKQASDKLAKKDLLDKIKNGEADIVIGTHALIQEKIEFKNLALAIIDEQHRFGVSQRKELTQKSGDAKTAPHLLSMTATPIPRSLALAVYGDLSISIIREMPKGRKPIITQIVNESDRGACYAFIKEQIKAGRQAFVVCPLIDPSDKLGVKSAKEEFKKLNNVIFKDLKIAMLHGRLKSNEKEQIMRDFLENKINILVATSVVEVGVDAPNATIMLIEGSERFGLAQLHQFRGRVGRSKHQSHCFLFKESNVEKAEERLNAFAGSQDGFALAQADLKLRGPGEVYGTAQKGFPDLKIASLFDYELMKQAKDQVEMLFEKDLSLAKWPLLKEKLKDIQNEVHLE